MPQKLKTDKNDFLNAMDIVLKKWEERIDEINSIPRFNIGLPKDLKVELCVLKNCITEIKAARFIDHDENIEGFKTILNK